MEYRSLGRSGVRVSEIGFGTGANAGLMTGGEQPDQVAAITRAVELGVNYFDTAPMYGQGRAETALGQALRTVGAHNAVVTTKIGVFPEDLDNVAACVERSFEASLRRLGMDHVDVLQVHNPPWARNDPGIYQWTPVTVADFLGPRGALEAMHRLQQQGKVRLLGFTCELAEPEPVKALLDTGAFDVINVWYGLLNPTAGVATPAGLQVLEDYGQIVDYAAERGVGVAVFRALGGGALTGQAFGLEPRHPLSTRSGVRETGSYDLDLRKAAALGFLARDGQRTLTQAAYRFVLDHPGVSTVIGGFSEVAHLEAAAGWRNGAPFSPAELELIRRTWERNFGLAERS